MKSENFIVLIFIVQELKPNGRKISGYVVPNNLTLYGIHENRRLPENMMDVDNHGTYVAQVAGGVNYGVASKADLHFVKWKNAYSAVPLDEARWPEDIRHPIPSFASIVDFCSHILDHIQSNKKQGKAVVSISFGNTLFNSHTSTYMLIFDLVFPNKEAFMRDSWMQFIQQLETYDAVLVVAAGNWGREHTQDLNLPHVLGRDDNMIITVGGVKADGSFHDITTLPKNDRSGTITVYAQSLSVPVLKYGPETPPEGEKDLMKGTSLAAPAVVSS